jgi:hypothetical protein
MCLISYRWSADFADNRAIVGNGSWDNGWDSRNSSRCARITFKVRQGNGLVDFEPFLRSQTLYPTELRARTNTSLSAVYGKLFFDFNHEF